MDFALSFNPAPLERIAWALAGRDSGGRVGLGSECPRARQSEFDSPTSGATKPMIVHLFEGGSVTEAANLAHLVVGRLAHHYRFACISLGHPSSRIDELRHRGVTVHLVERSPGLDWRCTGRLAALLQREKAELVHAHQSSAFFYALFSRLQ